MGPGTARLALALLMLGVFANDHDAALALDDLAFFANGLDGRTNFHLWHLLMVNRRVPEKRNAKERKSALPPPGN